MTRRLVALQIRARQAMDRDRGATAVEYGLLVALIAAVIVATVGLLGTRSTTRSKKVLTAIAHADACARLIVTMRSSQLGQGMRPAASPTDESGATAIEYALMASLIAAVIGVTVACLGSSRCWPSSSPFPSPSAKQEAAVSSRPRAATDRRAAADRQSGAAAVELALVLPILLVLVFGIVDFGRAYNAQISLTQAAREGARVRALGGDAAATTARVQLAAGFLPAASVSGRPGSGLPCHSIGHRRGHRHGDLHVHLRHPHRGAGRFRGRPHHPHRQRSHAMPRMSFMQRVRAVRARQDCRGDRGPGRRSCWPVASCSA